MGAGVADVILEDDGGLAAEQVEAALAELRAENLSAQQMVDRISQFAEESGPTDDVTVVVVKRRNE